MRSLLLILCAALLAATPLLAADVDQVMDPEHATGQGDPHRAGFAASTCAECHACSEPTREDPCLAGCPRHGAHFYGEHASDDGPDVVIIDQLANLYEPVVFAHKLHAEMGEMGGGCVLCHHYSETSGEIPPCRSCHEVSKLDADLRMPALKGAYHRQCMNCHRDWSHENACGFCHEEANGDAGAADAAHDPTDITGVPHPMVSATPTYTYETTYVEGPVVTFHHSDHVELFGQKCVDCHRGDSCASCHDQEVHEKKPVDHVASCGTCHIERDCGFCHDREPMPRFDHARSTGFDLEPYHSGNTCNSCHVSPKQFQHPTGKCADCHIHWEVGNFDHKVTGLVLSEDHAELDCDNCHVDMDMSATPSCVDCHDDYEYPDVSPEE
jgi:hypothetical protein